jgi:ubiquinone/menaquinone biosynthesis C-methylase UbiE
MILMDYDNTAIASKYDAARGYRPEVLRQWIDIIAAHVPVHPALIVDLGCGTGRFSYPLADRFQTRVIGIDPSEKMLEVARRQLTDYCIEFHKAAAENIPLPNGCADVVFMSMVLHHLQDRACAARECCRVLSERGRVCVRNSTRETTFPQSRFFPGTLPMIQRELPSRDEVVAMFERAGLRLSVYLRVPHLQAASWKDLADKLAMRADSFLARLSDTEFEAGLAALRAHASASDPNETISEEIEFFAFGH